MKPRKCQWCGEPFTSNHPTKQFCSKAHKQEAANFMASRGKVLMPIALAWRAKRGRKGTSGAQAYAEMVEFIDKMVAELTAQGCPTSSGFFELARRSGSGASTWKDFDRRRPSQELEGSPEEV